MENIEQAYRVLGLEPFADKEEVEKRYSTLLKRERARSKREDITGAYNDDFTKITEAYRQILDYETKKYTEAFEEQEYGKYKKLAGKAKKFDHFWRYYKIHTFVAIAIIGIIIYATVSIIEKQEEKRYLASLPPIDIQISFLGEFFDFTESDDMKTVEDKLLADFPQHERIEADVIYVPTDESMKYNYIQKAMVLLITETPDLYILDEDMAAWASQNDMFVPLDEVEALAPLMDTDYVRTFTSEETGQTYVYAIDLTKTSLAEDIQMAYPEMLVGIRADANHPENAIEFITKYATELIQ